MHSSSSLSFAALILAHASVVFASPVQAQAVAVLSTVPQSAAGPIDLSFPGFAFEEESFYLYGTDANGKANTFSQNLIKDVLKRTGGTPILRVGGTSGDYAHYNASQAAATNPAGEAEPQLTKPPYLSVGKKFFTAFNNFPGAKFIFAVPLALRDLNNTLAWTTQGLAQIGNSLDAVEIGNEPTAYSWFTTQAYVDEFLKFQQAIVKAHPELGQTASFQGLDTPSGDVSGLQVSTAFHDGLNKTGAIKQVAYHYYQGTDQAGESLATLQSNIVNHTAIKSKLSTYQPQIQALRQINPTAPFILSENGNTLGKGDMHNRNNLGTALWNVDFQLQCMAIGVTRVNMQQIFYPGYAMWQPQDGPLIPAGVHANYYSQPFVADFLGSSGNTRVTELKLNTNAPADTTAGYAAYDNGKLARIALLNMKLWDGQGTRPSANISLSGLPSSTKSVTAQYLTAPSGVYANDTLTYAGLQWSYPSGQSKQVKQDSRTFTVTNGQVTVPVDATSAMLLTV